ncbi:membrane hypothetical protein [metagenome]|uniref:RDD domain-containing protein n=1 Tax=metagenome TaxID=256318 RepID=A0A2P2C920_9ZZZZ
MAQISDNEQSFRPIDAVAAPHGGRLIAFGVDLLVVLLIGVVIGGGWVRILVVFVGYHTALVWLTGQTIGKAVANIEVRRADGRRYERTAKGLPWALGRASIGYLVVDMLGLGVLVAAAPRNPTRRCLHDLVFGSRVILRGPTQWALPKVRTRLSDFAARREVAAQEVEDAHPDTRQLSKLWHWAITGALALEKVLDYTQHAITQVSSMFGGAGQAHAGGAVLSTKATAGVVVGTGVVTVGAVTALAIAVAPSDGGVIDSWTSSTSTRVTVVDKVGDRSYVGRAATRRTHDATGCLIRANQEVWRFSGSGPTFAGEVRWSQGRDGENCRFRWGRATFVFDDHDNDDLSDDTLGHCSTDPFDEGAGGEECREYHRS